MIAQPIISNKSIITSDYLGEEVLNLLDRTFQIPSDGFKFTVLDVTDEYIARPDLVSLDAYGDDAYTGIICKINGLSNPFELNAGDRLILPVPEDLSIFVFESTEKDDGKESNINTPTPKKKNTKRSANEAITGSKRFDIDTTNGVIIY